MLKIGQNADRSNLAAINMNPDSSFNFRFSYKDFVPGVDAATTWQAWVQDPSKDARLVVTFMDRAGNDSTIDIRYNAFKITASPDLDFGTVEMGDTVEKEVWFINESTTSNGYVVYADFKSKNQGFEIVNLSLPQMVPPNDSIKIKVHFIATQNGDYLDSIGVGDSCWFYYRIQVKAHVGIVDVKDNNNQDNLLTLFPNPVEDNLTIQFNSNSENI